MLKTFLGCTVTYLLLIRNGKSYGFPVLEYDKGLRYEEYRIEHEISATQAKNAALSIDLKSFDVPPGCQKCSIAELNYCLGGDLINDHCTCDRRYHEVFPFIPHTCYIGAKLSKPVIGDCGEYARLRTCCCDKYVAQKWKDKLTGSSATCTRTESGRFNVSIILCIVLLIFFTQ